MRERILPLILQVGESQCTDPRVLKKVADVLKNSRGMMNHVQKCICFMFTLNQEYEGELFSTLFREHPSCNLLLLGAAKVIRISALFRGSEEYARGFFSFN